MMKIWNPTSISPLILLVTALARSFGQAPPAGMAALPNGVYRPFVRTETDPEQVRVKAFLIDLLPVTNGDFLEFLRANPHWQRSQVKPPLADESYLRDWSGDLALDSNSPPNAPVTYVSLPAAKAYAEWKGKRLPTTAEWEYAASASQMRPDGANDPEFKRQVAQWYSTPAAVTLPSVGSGPANFWGVHDLHGLVWEWVADFNSAMAANSPGSRTGREAFCGVGSQGARDLGDYPAFMRYGFRSSLKPAYCVHNLGFRCAKDL